jgi:hypothetical protein
MKCEHAKDFFSEYIEQSLDKPTGVALEAHLTACGACQRELEGLRQTWGALNAVPSLEPPADLAWRVMCQLQEEKLQRLEAEQTRKARNPFIGWLQALTPGAAFGYATLTALLIIAVLFPLRNMLKPGVIMGIGGGTRPATAVALVNTEMTLMSARQDGSGSWIRPFVITPPADLVENSVTVNPVAAHGDEWVEGAALTRALTPGQSTMIPVPATVGDDRVLAVRVHLTAAGRTMDKTILASSPR